MPSACTLRTSESVIGQGGEGRSLTVLSSIFVVLRLYHENLRAEFAQPFSPLPYILLLVKCQPLQ